MSVQSSSTIPAVEAPPATDPSFETRWAAWVERGHQHDLVSARRLRVAALGTAVLGLIVVLFVAFAGGVR